MPSKRFEALLERYQDADSEAEALVAIEAMKDLAEEGDVDASFEVGEVYEYYFEDIGLDAADYDTAVEYYGKAADEGHGPSLKELGLIYSMPEWLDEGRSIECLLLSGDYSRENELILRLIRQYSQKVDRSSQAEVQRAVKELSRFISLCKSKTLLTALIYKKNEFFETLALAKVKAARNIGELEDAHAFFAKYESKDYLEDVVRLYRRRGAELLVSSFETVKDAEARLGGISDQALRNAAIKWIAESYEAGKNGATKDIGKAIRAYEMAGTYFASEIESLITKACYRFLEEGDFASLERYYPRLKETHRNYFEKEIKKHKEAVFFRDALEKAKSGDEGSCITVGRCYWEGYGVAHSLNDAVSWYEKAYKAKRSKEAFDFLFDHSGIRLDSQKFGAFLKDAKAHGISFSMAQEEAYDRIFRAYATSVYEDDDTYGLQKVDITGNVIYHLYDYFKKWWVDTYPDNQVYRDNFFCFVNVKKGRYSQSWDKLKFPVALRNFFRLFSGKWIICTAPGHEQTDNFTNEVCRIIRMVSEMPAGMTIRNTVIRRTKTVEKKATSSSGRNNDYRVDMRSLGIEPGFDPSGKDFIVVDDITTSGSTLIACRNILLNAGASHVVCLALGKTRDIYD